jgi:hypothetical protein
MQRCKQHAVWLCVPHTLSRCLQSSTTSTALPASRIVHETCLHYACYCTYRTRDDKATRNRKAWTRTFVHSCLTCDVSNACPFHIPDIDILGDCKPQGSMVIFTQCE